MADSRNRDVRLHADRRCRSNLRDQLGRVALRWSHRTLSPLLDRLDALSEEREENSIDIYHHFPCAVEGLLDALVNLLTSPIQIDVTTHNDQIHMVLTPQQPKEN